MKAVYTLEDLRDRARLDEGAVKPARLAVLGFPIHHSASPQMHQAALDALDINARYIRIEVEPGQVAEAFRRMRELGFIGCNVTVPHKLEAMQACDKLTAAAQNLGATNTIHFTNEGIIGHNTDGPGLIAALKADLDFTPKDAHVLLLGAGGGAGKAIAAQLSTEGVAELFLANRTLSKAEKLQQKLSLLSDANIQATGCSVEELAALAPKADLIINATSIGLKPEDPSPFPVELIQPHHLVYDAIYNPPKTALLKAAEQSGARISNGLSMLVHQGALAFEMWMGVLPDIQLMRSAIS